MKTFELSRKMLNMSGQFYPTGHIVAMFPTAEAARSAYRAMLDAGVHGDEIALIAPEVMLKDVVHTIGQSGMTLPAAGTEADTVRRFAQYASQGHHALLVHAPHDDEAERVMQALGGHPVSHAQRYRMLVIEDLA